MYRKFAYLKKMYEDIIDNSQPLIITAVGNYRVHTTRADTERPNGRSDYQLIYIASGCAHFYFDGVKKIIPKGNVVLYRPGETQMYYLFAEDKAETCWVHFTGYDVDNMLNLYQIPKNENVFFIGTSPDYQRLFHQMIQELRLKRINYDKILNINLTHLFLIINRYLHKDNTIIPDMLDEIEIASNYFNEHYNEKIVIEEYAQCHGMTANWFIQSFRKVMKYTPLQYIVHLRMTNAIFLMENTDYNMTEIASEVGYENSMYFSRIFKKYIGMTPTEYKHKVKPIKLQTVNE